MDFEEFCEDAFIVHQLEALCQWEQHFLVLMNFLRSMETELLTWINLELGISTSIPVHVVRHDWIMHTGRKAEFLWGLSVISEHYVSCVCAHIWLTMEECHRISVLQDLGGGAVAVLQLKYHDQVDERLIMAYMSLRDSSMAPFQLYLRGSI
ncbi:protein kinase superfamily protein [Actinidia rufa]|uniref:Protein kinase superfamily protein n=1 Tax=Actinidia rufa TaxID=165716 RepID=A0A7J0DWE6_9ERIC|nr:protein kinase superfamily protein [Actinidia rufa]